MEQIYVERTPLQQSQPQPAHAGRRDVYRQPRAGLRLDRLIDAVLPQRCLGCGVVLPPARERIVSSSTDAGAPRGPTSPFCRSCDHRLVRLHDGCPRCGGPTAPAGCVCPSCAGTDVPIEQTYAAFRYEDAARLVAAVKNGTNRGALQYALSAMSHASRGVPAGAVVVPVPDRPGARRSRGFSPVRRLANGLAYTQQRTIISPLFRDRGLAQKTLTREGRRTNLVGAIHLRRAVANGVPEVCLLVDDVRTTGATLLACASELREAGAKRVWCVVLATDA